MAPPAAPPVRRSPKALAAAELAARQNAPNPWKRLVIGAVALAAIVGIGFGVYQLGGGGQPAAANNTNGNGTGAQAAATAPAINQAKVSALMAKLQANPQDTTTLMALGNEFYAGQQFDVAAGWFDKVLAIKPGDIPALLARGAVSFNLNDLKAAETTWQKVVALDPKNVEVHYDLGFLYLNQPTPDWTGVQREWNLVVSLDPTSNLAQTVKSHLESLAASSMIPSASGGSGVPPSGSPSASGSPTGAPAPSGSPAASSPATSPAPSGSPAASTKP